MDNSGFVDGLLKFIGASPTPFHAVAEMKQRLIAAGYSELSEHDAWQPGLRGSYFVTRNDSSIIAFRLDKPLVEHGMRMVGAHTDSPCLKIKPNPVISDKGYLQLGVEVYGGALLNPWFDRDLSLAGRVSYRSSDGSIRHTLIDWQQPMATMPSLAIHLDREANENRKINKQTDLPPVLMCMPEPADADAWQALLLEQLKGQGIEGAGKVLAYELSLYDVNAPARIGVEGEFIASARLDNLLSCYAGLEALLAADGANALLVCNDHEEVGSSSTSGAQGNFLSSVLERLSGSREDFARMIAASLMISADNAHALHPNYADRHEPNHGPMINAGPVLKVNANQRYASSSRGSAIFADLCEQSGVPMQSFVVRSDMGCGSTIGPITAAGIGVETIDIGVPTWAMHSIRELAGSEDAGYLYRVLTRYYSD